MTKRGVIDCVIKNKMICIDRCKSRMVRLLTEYPLTFFLSQIFIHLCIVVVLVSDGDLVSETDDKDVRINISFHKHIFNKKHNHTVASSRISHCADI